MGAEPISWTGMLLAFVPVVISLGIFRFLKVPHTTDLLVGVSRMGVQLVLVGAYLTILFDINHPLVTIGYLSLMIAAANYSVLKNSGIRLSMYFAILPALAIALFAVLSWYTVLVFRPSPIYEARYVIPIAGMLLGNSMRRVIITLERFYTSIRDDSEGFAALVIMGANRREASLPYLRVAYRAGVGPSLANMATMGVVSLPGMMTGQILGGSAPIVAIQYQIAITLGIFVATELASVLCVLISLRKGFDHYGYLRMEVLKPTT